MQKSDFRYYYSYEPGHCVLYLVVGNGSGNRIVNVQVLEVIDDNSLEVCYEGRNWRFILAGIGLMNSLLTAEDEARAGKLGIWNRNRELFRSASNSSSAHGVLG